MLIIIINMIFFPFTDRFAHFICNQSFIINSYMVETAILLFNNISL